MAGVTTASCVLTTVEVAVVVIEVTVPEKRAEEVGRLLSGVVIVTGSLLGAGQAETTVTGTGTA